MEKSRVIGEYEKDYMKEREKGMKVVEEGSDGMADGTRVQPRVGVRVRGLGG
ncbi:hypothetical protein AYX13_07007 [Cryptococcus neoformans]|nr:hypothetical protein AYX13_07007 [Cryptococcus neoformans var. grubii]